MSDVEILTYPTAALSDFSQRVFQHFGVPEDGARLAAEVLATSAVAYGKIEIARRKQVPVPDGWICDARGAMSNNPLEMIHGGALLPLGSDRDHGGHKGFAWRPWSTFSAACSAGRIGVPPFALRQEIPERSVGKGIGHFFGAMRIDGFIDPDEFKTQIDDWIRTFRKTPPAPGSSGPLIPGDLEREAEAIRSQTGIPLILPVVEDLRDISRQTGIPFD